MYNIYDIPGFLLALYSNRQFSQIKLKFQWWKK